MIAFLLAGCLLCACFTACSFGGTAADVEADPTAAPTPGAAVGEVYSKKGIFFSSDASDGGDGSLEKPYNDLSVIPSLEITKGTHIYLERGSAFCGSLVLSGISGSRKAPVVVSAYGEGDRPKIDGNDLTGSGILHIENCSNLIVEELELYDSATEEGDRRGVLITCDNVRPTQNLQSTRPAKWRPPTI